MLFAALLAAGLHATPSAVAPAHAATNCDTLPSRLDAYARETNTYNSQVGAINARGGGNPGQVAYYNSWKSRLVAQRSALNGELSRCKSQGRLGDVRPPTGPGERNAPPPRQTPPPPRQTNPTPGFPAPQQYRPGSNVVSDRTNSIGSREVRFRDGGTASLFSLERGRASGISGRLSAGMRDQGTPSVPRITPRGYGGKFNIRGHLLANRLGGLGGDARNIMAITRSANARMSQVENHVYRALKTCGGGKVDYTVIPVYGRSVVPERIVIRAVGCGLNISRVIPNV
ncbi:DNA/RNA non-specific endonuclease [Gordonia sp. ABKF26]|uniref:DNA/RNA non-specific endonuclease n=1 Tax=Gordonia sp. ABKF26 TaxID=3238687 RepID=UPI0034E4E298